VGVLTALMCLIWVGLLLYVVNGQLTLALSSAVAGNSVRVRVHVRG
jgi:hypothetical protein